MSADVGGRQGGSATFVRADGRISWARLGTPGPGVRPLGGHLGVAQWQPFLVLSLKPSLVHPSGYRDPASPSSLVHIGSLFLVLSLKPSLVHPLGYRDLALLSLLVHIGSLFLVLSSKPSLVHPLGYRDPALLSLLVPWPGLPVLACL